MRLTLNQSHGINTNVTWDEAEKLFPECSAAWDRDVGDIGEFKLITIDGANRLIASVVGCAYSLFKYDNIHYVCLCKEYMNGHWIKYNLDLG